MMTNTLLFGDCLELMPTLPAGIIDLILCDLPYGTTACAWDTIIPLEPLWKEYRRQIKPGGVIVLTSAGKFTTLLNVSNLGDLKYEWIWDKCNAKGHLNAKIKPLQKHETVSVFAAVPLGQFTYNPQMETRGYRQKGGKGKQSDCYSEAEAVVRFSDQYYPTSIIQFPNANVNGKIHPTQKPVALMEYLIRTYTNEGDTVLDNCFGSGTTGVACVNTRRNFVGIEQDAQYFQLGSRRITEAEAKRDNRTGLFA